MNPVIKKSRSISPIWIVPVVAAIICGSLFYNSYKNAGIKIELYLKNATGITAGKTKVMVRGIPVGTVDHIRPDLQKDRITATIQLNREMEKMLVEDTIFWVVRPRFSTNAISGLETILSGSYINVQPGTSKISSRTFIAAEQPPPPPDNTPGLHLVLKAKELGSLQAGSGIYYKNIQIGAVEQTRLRPEENSVELQVLIKPAYKDLVREGSRFCNASGIQMKGNISNISLKIASVAALLRGGIELFTPKALINTPLAKNHASYPLYTDFEAAEYGLPLTLRLNSSRGIVEGSTKIIYQGLVAGTVKKLEISPGENRGVTAYIQLDPRAKDILRKNTKFWMVKPEISPTGAQNLRLFITGSYITFQPGDGSFKDDFDILPSPPAQLPQRPGQLFHLHSAGKAPVANGSPVHFKGIQIGEVITVALDDKSDGINTDIFIYQDYLHLINANSLFWVQSGVKVKAGITSGLSVETSPLTSMLFGGITVSSPAKGDAPAKGQVFPLHADYTAAMAKSIALYGDEKIITLTAENSGSLTVGAPVLFNDIQIGEIKGWYCKANSRKTG